MGSENFDDRTFQMPRAEILAKFRLFNDRIQRNPLVSRKYKGYSRTNLLVLERFASERDLQYGLQLLGEFIDDLRAINVRRQDPALKESLLNQKFEAAIDNKIAHTPEEMRKPIVVDFLANFK